MPGTRPSYPARICLVHSFGSGALNVVRGEGHVKLVDFEGRLAVATMYIKAGVVVEVVHTH